MYIVFPFKFTKFSGGNSRLLKLWKLRGILLISLSIQYNINIDPWANRQGKDENLEEVGGFWAEKSKGVMVKSHRY